MINSSLVILGHVLGIMVMKDWVLAGVPFLFGPFEACVAIQNHANQWEARRGVLVSGNLVPLFM